MRRIVTTLTALAIAVALLAVVALTGVPAADNGKREAGEGKYADLTALWWQWALGQPFVDVGGTNTNPVQDSTGEYAAAGQENGIGPANKFFFLAGTWGGDAERTVTVPKGKSLFFPVIDWDMDNATLPPTNFTVPELRAVAKANIDLTISTYARLDGVPLEIFRTKSPTFAYTLPAENTVYDYFYGPDWSVFDGMTIPAVSDGYWVYIPPLAPGDYVLEFGSSHAWFSVNVIYHLTIE